jgi:hypothetical protein
VVVDLAVERDPDRSVLVRHRLYATGKVDDAEPTMPEDDVPGLFRLFWATTLRAVRAHTEKSLVVGPSMSEPACQLDNAPRKLRVRVAHNDPRDPAHARYPPRIEA